MDKNKTFINFRKPFSAVAAIALCLCLTVGAAAGLSGYFRDITGYDGAVTGTEYLRAAEELEVTAEYINGCILISAEAANNEKMPYSEIEFISIEEYSITNRNGDTVFTGEKTDYADFSGGKAQITLKTAELEKGSYTLTINSFTGSKKADQPIPVISIWKCDFTV